MVVPFAGDRRRAARLAGHAAPGVALVALWAADKTALTLTGTPV
nr:hypothetical protein [Micromonospora provocatoris]